MLGGNLFIALGGGAIVRLVRGVTSSAIGPAPVALMALIVVAAWGFLARGSVLNRWEAALLIASYGVTLPFSPR